KLSSWSVRAWGTKRRFYRCWPAASSGSKTTRNSPDSAVRPWSSTASPPRATSKRRCRRATASARPTMSSCSAEASRKYRRKSVLSSAKAGEWSRFCGRARVSGAPLSCCALAECSRNALSLTLLRHSYRDLSRSPPLSSEGLMPQPREGQNRGFGPRARGRAAAAAVVAVVVAGPASAQTLTEAFAYAYNNNPQLLAQRALLRSTDESVPQALSNWRPTVNFTGQAAFTRGGFEQPNPITGAPTPTQFASFVSKQLDLRITQPIYRGGRTEAATRQAINGVQAARAQTLGVETTVFQAVAQGYLDVVRDQTLVEVSRNNEAVLRKQLEATRDRLRVGEVTRTDVAQAESALAQATAQRIQAEGNLETSRSNFTRAVGHPPGRLLLPRERPVLPATREEALSLAANDNPNVISASFTELAARDNVDFV